MAGAIQNPATTVCLPDQTDKAPIDTTANGACRTLDEQLGCHAGALEARRQRQDTCRPIEPLRQTSDVDVRSRDVWDGAEPNGQCNLLRVDDDAFNQGTRDGTPI